MYMVTDMNMSFPGKFERLTLQLALFISPLITSAAQMHIIALDA